MKSSRVGSKQTGFKSEKQRRFFEVKLRALIGEDKKKFMAWLYSDECKKKGVSECKWASYPYVLLSYHSISALAAASKTDVRKIKFVVDVLSTSLDRPFMEEGPLFRQCGKQMWLRDDANSLERANGLINKHIKWIAATYKNNCGADALAKLFL